MLHWQLLVHCSCGTNLCSAQIGSMMSQWPTEQVLPMKLGWFCKVTRPCGKAQDHYIWQRILHLAFCLNVCPRRQYGIGCLIPAIPRPHWYCRLFDSLWLLPLSFFPCHAMPPIEPKGAGSYAWFKAASFHKWLHRSLKMQSWSCFSFSKGGICWFSAVCNMILYEWFFTVASTFNFGIPPLMTLDDSGIPLKPGHRTQEKSHFLKQWPHVFFKNLPKPSILRSCPGGYVPWRIFMNFFELQTFQSAICSCWMKRPILLWFPPTQETSASIHVMCKRSMWMTMDVEHHSDILACLFNGSEFMTCGMERHHVSQDIHG